MRAVVLLAATHEFFEMFKKFASSCEQKFNRRSISCVCKHSSESEIDMGSVWTIVGRSESEIFCSGSEIFHSGSEIFCSECEKKIVAILVCTHGDILVILADILGDILSEHFCNRRAFFSQHIPTVI